MNVEGTHWTGTEKEGQVSYRELVGTRDRYRKGGTGKVQRRRGRQVRENVGRATLDRCREEGIGKVQSRLYGLAQNERIEKLLNF